MTLLEEISTDPMNRGYAQYIPHSPGKVTELLNELIYTMPKTKFITARTILAEYGEEGAGILDKLEIASQSIPAVKWAFKFMTQDSGIDIGHNKTREMLDSLVQLTVITQDESDKIKNLGLQPASRVEILGLGAVTELQVRDAIQGIGV